MKRLLAMVLLFASPSLAQTYDPTLIPPEMMGSPTTMTQLWLGDDNTTQVTLNFPFEYFGQTYTSAWVSSNGFVSFGTSANLCCNGLPLEQAPRNTIYAYWTDLVDWSTGNPFMRQTNSDALFGWYNTKEYGTNNLISFEINLNISGDIQINYGNVRNSYHQVTAGLTGPTSSDNIQLFYGSNVTGLANQSGLLSYASPTPETPDVDCSATPNDPECVVAYSPVQVAVATEASPQTDAAETPVSEAVTDVATTEPAATETVVEETAVVEDTAEETTATEEVVVVEEAQAEPEAEEVSKSDERLSLEQVLALAASSDEVAQEDAVAPAELATMDAQATTQDIGPQSEQQQSSQQADGQSQESVSTTSDAAGSTDQAKQETQIQIASVSVATAESSTEARETSFKDSTIAEQVSILEQTASMPDAVPITPITVQQAEEAITEDLHSGFQKVNKEEEIIVPVIEQPMPQQDFVSGQTTTMILLDAPNNAPSMVMNSDVGEVNKDNAMENLAVAPEGYGEYSQARIPDVAFYKPRDIYVGRKLSDANWELYRMMSSQDGKWKAMVESQYER